MLTHTVSPKDEEPLVREEEKVGELPEVDFLNSQIGFLAAITDIV